MNTFKSNIMDSIDEGISNLVTAPVLIVQKNWFGLITPNNVHSFLFLSNIYIDQREKINNF